VFIRIYREAFSGLPRAVWILVLVGFINRTGTMVMPFLALYLTARHGFSAAGAGAMLSLYGIGAAAGTLAGGWLCDRTDPNRVQVASLLAGGVGLVALGFVEGRWAIAVTIAVVAAVGEAFRPANSTALALACSPADRPRAFALRRLALNLGMTFGPAIGGFLALYDYRWLFLADGATCLLAALPARALLVPARRPAVAAGGETAPAVGRSPWRDGPFLALMGLFTVLAVLLFQLWGAYALTMRSAYGLGENKIGLLFAVNTLLIVGFEMVVVQAARGFAPLKVVGVGAALLGGGLGMIPFGAGFGYAALGAVVWTVGEMLSLPIAEAVVANRAGAGQSGRYMGLFTTSFSLAFVLAPLAGTATYERFGSDALWLGCGVLGLVLWAGFAALSGRLGRG
jgi:MFS family permease